jgi:hypothetical protein
MAWMLPPIRRVAVELKPGGYAAGVLTVIVEGDP